MQKILVLVAALTAMFFSGCNSTNTEDQQKVPQDNTGTEPESSSLQIVGLSEISEKESTMYTLYKVASTGTSAITPDEWLVNGDGATVDQEGLVSATDVPQDTNVTLYAIADGATVSMVITVLNEPVVPDENEAGTGGAPEQITASDLVFPVDTTAGSWFIVMGSDYHLPGQGFFQGDDTFALDLNLPGDDDFGQDVHLVAPGMIVYTDPDEGFVLIKHTNPLVLDDGTLLQDWYSGYMHLDLTDIATADTPVGTDSVIGQVSNVTTKDSEDDPMPHHLHFALYKGGQDYWTQGALESIDVFNRTTSFVDSVSRIVNDGCMDLELVDYDNTSPWWRTGYSPCNFKEVDSILIDGRNILNEIVENNFSVLTNNSDGTLTKVSADWSVDSDLVNVSEDGTISTEDLPGTITFNITATKGDFCATREITVVDSSSYRPIEDRPADFDDSIPSSVFLVDYEDDEGNTFAGDTIRVAVICQDGRGAATAAVKVDEQYVSYNSGFVDITPYKTKFFFQLTFDEPGDYTLTGRCAGYCTSSSPCTNGYYDAPLTFTVQ